MEGHKLLSRMQKVQAPPGFEQRVLAELSRRKHKRVKTRRMSLVFAGACASLAVILMVANFGGLLQRQPSQASVSAKEYAPDLRPGFPAGPRQGIIPITETFNYSGEVRSLRKRPQTVYILEYVSDSTDTEYKF